MSMMRRLLFSPGFETMTIRDTHLGRSEAAPLASKRESFVATRDKYYGVAFVVEAGQIVWCSLGECCSGGGLARGWEADFQCAVNKRLSEGVKLA
jgi:hypothetical protein